MMTLLFAKRGVLRYAHHHTSPAVLPAISVCSLVKYSAVGNDSSFTATPVSWVNLGNTSLSVSSSDPVRTCRRNSPPSFLDAAGACAAGWAVGAGGGGVGAAQAARS